MKHLKSAFNFRTVRDNIQTGFGSWSTFWFGSVPLHQLAVCRMGLGASMFFAYVLYGPFVETIFGPESLGNYLLGNDFIIREHTWPIYWLTLISAACFTLGLLTPLSGIALICGHLLFIEPGRFFSWGWVPTAPAFLWYLSLGPSGKLYSLDAWLWSKLGKTSWTDRGPAYSLRLIQVHVIAVYIGASWHRIDDVAWWRGEMVFDAVEYAYYSRFPNVPWSHLKPILEVANYVVWGLELAAPFGLLYKPTRLWFAGGLWLMHFGLEVTSTIGWWQFMMMSVLFTYFPLHWSQRLLALGRSDAAPRDDLNQLVAASD